MWPDLIQKAKEGGLDVIQTYVFWNGHEPLPGKVMDTGSFFFFFILFCASMLCLWNCVFELFVLMGLICYSITLRGTMIWSNLSS
jgi:hypothetical protein